MMSHASLHVHSTTSQDEFHLVALHRAVYAQLQGYAQSPKTGSYASYWHECKN